VTTQQRDALLQHTGLMLWFGYGAVNLAEERTKQIGGFWYLWGSAWETLVSPAFDGGLQTVANDTMNLLEPHVATATAQAAQVTAAVKSAFESFVLKIAGPQWLSQPSTASITTVLNALKAQFVSNGWYFAASTTFDGLPATTWNDWFKFFHDIYAIDFPTSGTTAVNSDAIKPWNA
jgi:hypothetical protein